MVTISRCKLQLHKLPSSYDTLSCCRLEKHGPRYASVSRGPPANRLQTASPAAEEPEGSEGPEDEEVPGNRPLTSYGAKRI